MEILARQQLIYEPRALETAADRATGTNAGKFQTTKITVFVAVEGNPQINGFYADRAGGTRKTKSQQ